MVQSDENDLHVSRCAHLKIAMTMRKIEIHDRETEYHDGKIENVELGCASAAPGGGSRQLKVQQVQEQDEQRDDVFGIVIPVLALQAVHPNETHGRANGDGNQADEDARLAHALEKFLRRQSPDKISHVVGAQQAVLHQENQADDERERE